MARFPVSLLITAAFLYPARRAFPSETQPAQAKADRVLVLKKERKLILLSGEKEFKTYRISLGGDAVGPKQREGDHKTPEGTYVLDRRNPHSKFYRSIHISYPNQKDRKRAQRLGVPPVATFSFMACPTDSAGSANRTLPGIGPTAVLL